MALQQDSYLAMRIETRSNGVAVVTLNRPERLNAVNGTLHHELARFTRDAEADPDVRVVVLAGGGGRLLECAKQEPSLILPS